jgi:hypothetical protein
MHAGIDVDEAWSLLHNQVPRLYPNATYNYQGKLQPKAIITAAVFREDVTFSIAFEVKDHGWITFPDNNVSNMTTRQEIYDHFSVEDPRIPPFVEYIEEDTRPYHDGDLVRFNLKGFIEITDRSNEGPGRNGGDNGRKIILPPIVYGNSPINITSPANPKVQGSATGPLDSDSESDSFPADSEEDLDLDFTHRLNRIHQAMHRKEPVFAVFVGEFQGYQSRLSQCEFRMYHNGQPPQSMDIFFQENLQRIRDVSAFLGNDVLPGALIWTLMNPSVADLDIQTIKSGRSLNVKIQHRSLKGLPMTEFGEVFVTDLPYGLSIAVPAVQNPTDADLMQLFQFVTAIPEGPQLVKPWQLYLEQKPWRKSETGKSVSSLL